MRFDDKVIVITGGGNGLGRAFADGFADEGARLALLDVDLDAARTAAVELGERGIEALAAHCDITDELRVAEVTTEIVERFGTIDVLVNNAGLHRRKYNEGFGALTPDEVRELLDVNVVGALNCSMACRPIMRAAGGGAIVNITSVSANAASSPYGVSKLALWGLTTALATEFAGDGIRVNAIAPGFVGSDGVLATADRGRLVAIMAGSGIRLPQQVIDRSTDDDLRAVITNNQLVRHEGRVSDIVAALLYLSSDDARFVNGEHLRVDGGSTIGF